MAESLRSTPLMFIIAGSTPSLVLADLPSVSQDGEKNVDDDDDDEPMATITNDDGSTVSSTGSAAAQPAAATVTPSTVPQDTVTPVAPVATPSGLPFAIGQYPSTTAPIYAPQVSYFHLLRIRDRHFDPFSRPFSDHSSPRRAVSTPESTPRCGQGSKGGRLLRMKPKRGKPMLGGFRYSREGLLQLLRCFGSLKASIETRPFSTFRPFADP